MDRTVFEKPVTVLVGLGFPARIESVAEAYALLADWPAASRNDAHSVALKGCRAALAGEVDAETARSLFIAFARRSHILVEPLAGAVIQHDSKRAGLDQR